VVTIRWTIGAQKDLREIIEYIGQDSTTYAAVMARRIITAIERLRRYPKVGRIIPEYDDETIRELIVI
jgi:plasmid stabilization system protein ParE